MMIKRNTIAKKCWLFCGYGQNDGQPWETVCRKTSTEMKVRWDDGERQLWLAFKYTDSDRDWMYNFRFMGASMFNFLLVALPVISTALFALRGIIGWAAPYAALCLFGAWAVFIVGVACFLQKPYRNQEFSWFVHRGIAIKWDSVKDYVRTLLDVARVKGYQAIISGHSQGGGMAQMAHELAVYKGLDAKTFVFGSLRILFFWGGRKAKGRFKGVVKFKEPGDVVPHVPFNILGYVDVGESVIVGPDRCPAFPWNWRKSHITYGDYLEEEKCV
jgi:hypothetical protein